MNISFEIILEKATTMSTNILKSDKHKIIDKYCMAKLEIEKENYIKLLFIKLFDIISNIDWLVIQTNDEKTKEILIKNKFIINKIFYIIQKAPIRVLKFINESFDLYKMELIDSQMIDEINSMRY